MLFTLRRVALLSFTVLLEAAALATQGCGTGVVDTSSGSTSGGTGGAGGVAVTCPPEEPQDGDPCAVSGECHYPEMCCGDTVATCPSGHWQVVGGPCVNKQPAMPCPTDLPTPGTPCSLGCLNNLCSYGACPDSSGPALTAQCLGGMWTLKANCGGGIPAGQPCGNAEDGGPCAAGLSCCYPCGIPGCTNTCTPTCDPSDPDCIGGCPLKQ
jgi:hypothetical protein